MDLIETESNQVSKIMTIASSSHLKIELFKSIGANDYSTFIKISEALLDDYGKRAVLTHKSIEKYFNKKGSIPFVARYHNKIIGYIIGIPIESLALEPWARTDPNFNNFNTLYTYAFVLKKEFHNKFHNNGYAKMLKRVYLNWAKNSDDIKFVTGHVKEGISNKFIGDIKIVNTINNWQGTGKKFEYYRRRLKK
tara:strand:+ start:2193 stop:2774 length:582 start_codon:yes stop_codon:yes gene_type:complete